MNFKFFLYIFLFVASIVPFLVDSNKYTQRALHNELYSDNLYRINSIDKAVVYIDSILSKQEIDTGKIVREISTFTKSRFYHGLSEYDAKQNWIACAGGKFIWSHLAAIVEPNDVLLYREGLCSQQAIVFMELLKRKGITTRSVGLGFKEGPGHFSTEVYYNGMWHLYDVNKEPKWERITNHHKSMDYYLNNKDTLYKVYEDQMDKDDFYRIMEKIEYGKPNQFPAKKMLLFHRVTKTFTYILPIFFFSIALFVFVKRKRMKSTVEATLEPKSVQEQVLDNPN